MKIVDPYPSDVKPGEPTSRQVRRQDQRSQAKHAPTPRFTSLVHHGRLFTAEEVRWDYLQMQEEREIHRKARQRFEETGDADVFLEAIPQLLAMPARPLSSPDPTVRILEFLWLESTSVPA